MGSESNDNHSDNLWSIISGNADEDHKDDDNGEDDEDESDVDNKVNATSSPTTSNKKLKYNAVMGMVTCRAAATAADAAAAAAPPSSYAALFCCRAAATAVPPPSCRRRHDVALLPLRCHRRAVRRHRR
jgi:hypothetical protein